MHPTQDQNRGGIKHVLIFSCPVIISQACDSLMMFTDRYLLSLQDSISPTASMSGGMTAFLLWVFGAGLLGFTTPLVSQFMGANAPDMGKRVVPQGLILSVILALPLLLWGKDLGEFYFHFLKLPVEEHPLAVQYLSVIIQSCFFVFAKVVFAGFFSGIGKTRIVMCVNVFGLLLNVPLSYFFIRGGWGPEWSGVRGAALGTVLAECCMAIAYASLFLKDYARGLKWSFDPTIFKKLIYFGVPTGVEFFVLTLAFNSFLTMFHSLGINTAQAITVTMNWSWLTILAFFGLNVGIMSLVGHALGEGNPKLAEKITKSGVIIAVAIVSIASCCFLCFTGPMIQFFGIAQDSFANDLAKIMIRTLPFYCFFDAISFVLTGTLRASGDTRYCLKVGMIGHWTCLVVCYLGIFYGNFTPLFAWGLFILNLFGQSLAYAYRYFEGSWKLRRVVDRV